METRVYTHALWQVRQGMEDEFVEAWAEMGAVFTSLPKPPVGPGTLIRSTTDPLRYYSFGPWRSAEDVAAMRDDPRARDAMERIRALCTEAAPGLYEVVREIETT